MLIDINKIYNEKNFLQKYKSKSLNYKNKCLYLISTTKLEYYGLNNKGRYEKEYRTILFAIEGRTFQFFILDI